METGKVELINVFENVAVDDTRKWEGEPKHEFLTECGEQDEDGINDDYICIETKIDENLFLKTTINGTF